MASTKETIIQLADEFMRKRGYNAFSYADIAKQLGVKNAAIHYHFPSKSDLAEAVMDWHIHNFEAFVEKASSKDEISKLKMFLNFYSSIQISGKVCMIGAVATDWNSMNEKVQGRVQEFADAVVSWLTETLEDGRENETLTFKASPRTEALRIITSIFAATQLARITGSEDFNQIKNSITEQLIN